MQNSTYYLSAGAKLSADEKYRYHLHRIWTRGEPQVVWIMLNPSKGDGTKDDPTIRRCVNFTRGWGFGGLWIVNLFALRTPKPKELLGSVLDPVGTENDKTVKAVVEAEHVQLVVAAWGGYGNHNNRDLAVRDLIKEVGKPLHCLGLTTDGSPRHPLYVPSLTRPVLYEATSPNRKPTK